MKLSKASAQAALAMAFLATCPTGELVQARTIGEQLNIPTDSALKILQALSRRGLILSQLGRSGGYRMHRPAQAVTLLEIVEAIDGPICGDISLQIDGAPRCSRIDLLHDVCNRAAMTVRQRLAEITVADLAPIDQPAPALAV